MLEEWCKSNGKIIVTLKNWHKYQLDSTGSERAKTLRSKRRREEKRGEEKKIQPPLSVSPPSNGFDSWPQEWAPIRERIGTLPFLDKHRVWLADLSWWKTLDDLFTSCPRSLDTLLTQAVAYIESEGYVPRTKRAIRVKLRNCMEFSARRAEREAQERRNSAPRDP